jgi:pimeloyl-ACP methyl ester carboxylesterase
MIEDASLAANTHSARRGQFQNGMEYLTWGGGAKTALFLQGGPGSELPAGMLLRLFQRRFRPYVAAGFAVWVVTRRRRMPAGHSVADMADDVAQAITDELGGRVDLVVGESYGGMIALYLAARHSDRVAYTAIVAAAAEVSAWGKQVDSQMAQGVVDGDAAAAGGATLDYLLPRDRLGVLRRLLGPALGRLMIARYKTVPRDDLLTEAQAEVAFDSRAVLPSIRGPVLLICGDCDQFFTREVVEETAALIPGCSLIWYAGKGHMKTAASGRVASDVLAFAARG